MYLFVIKKKSLLSQSFKHYKIKMSCHSYLIPVIIIIANLCIISFSENFEKEFKHNCLALSKKCTDDRIKRQIEDLSFVFRDVIFHYCLDLYHCTEGKKFVCHNVRPTETQYVEKSQRKRVIQQCKDWNIAVKFDNAPQPVQALPPAAPKSRPRARRVRKIMKN